MSRLYYEGGNDSRLYYDPWHPGKISGNAWKHICQIFDAFSGTWEGEYIYVDSNGQLTDKHSSKLELRRVGRDWKQSNTYTWADGRQLVFDFAAQFDENGELVFDTPRLKGKAWVSGESVLLDWEYQNTPPNKNFERINMIAPMTRMRSWQLSENGAPTGHVLIHEKQTSERCKYDV
jgi:hypothetical protein